MVFVAPFLSMTVFDAPDTWIPREPGLCHNVTVLSNNSFQELWAASVGIFMVLWVTCMRQNTLFGVLSVKKRRPEFENTGVWTVLAAAVALCVLCCYLFICTGFHSVHAEIPHTGVAPPVGGIGHCQATPSWARWAEESGRKPDSSPTPLLMACHLPQIMQARAAPLGGFTLGYQVGSIGQQQYQHADAPVYNQRQLASGMNLLQQVYQVHSSQSAMLTYNPFCISASNDYSMRFVIPR
jgi:hypothetical protein